MKSLVLLLVLVTLPAFRMELLHVVTPETITEESMDVTESAPDLEDSYLNALKESQAGDSSSNRRSEGQQRPPLYSTLALSSEVPSSAYPSLTYLPSTPLYLTPSSPSSHTYDPPATAPAMPFAAPQSLLPSLPKINLPTLFKIILKLVLFKMIVKFIAVICLLLFIPSITPKSEEGEERQMEQLNELTTTVWEGIFGNRTTPAEVKDVVDHLEEKSPAVSTDSALGFLEFCVSATNTMVGWMMSALRMQRGETDPLWELVWSRIKWFLQRL